MSGSGGVVGQVNIFDDFILGKLIPFPLSQTDSPFHLLDRCVVPGDLLLHQTLVLLQIRQSLLQVQVLLTLVRDGLIVDLAHVLQARHQVRHIVRVQGVQLVSHRLYLGPVHLDLLLVILQLFVRFRQ